DAPSSDGKLSYQEKKERERAVRKAKKEVADAENAIAELEQKIAEIEARFATGEVSDELCQEHAALSSAHEKAMHDWEAASENLEILENQK
ncbi:MAG: ABC transporter ATP-binding protein, partial [Bacteroidales bacterium]|nr:ABC transporter ATP-binding protein [Bacteroidales bacterium]